jgi:hypothetical protein
MHEILSSQKPPQPRFHYIPVIKAGAMAGLKGALPDLDLRLEQLIAARFFTTRFDQFAAINAAWDAALRELSTPPTRTSVGVVALPPRGHRGRRVRILQTALLDQLCQPRAAHPDPVFINVTRATAAGAAAYQ